MAQSQYLQVAPWMYCGPIHGTVSIQLGVATPKFLGQESIETWTDSPHNEMSVEPLDWEDGHITPRDKPWHGFALDKDALAAQPINEPSGDDGRISRRPHDRFRPERIGPPPPRSDKPLQRPTRLGRLCISFPTPMTLPNGRPLATGPSRRRHAR